MYPENRLAVDVYMNCQFDEQATMGGTLPVGVSANEVMSACRLMGVRPKYRREVLSKIRIMSMAACRYIMQRNEERRNRDKR